jgi:class 3 adenylate cyclase
VLKFVGDASIGYFPSSQNFDEIMLCGESVVYGVRNAINPLLLQMGHSGIEVKVTSNYGQHTIVRYGSDRERSHVDIIISATMNLAAKMQSVTRGGQMIIGDSLYKKLSHDLQRRFEKVNLDQIKWTTIIWQSKNHINCTLLLSDGRSQHSDFLINSYMQIMVPLENI